MQEYVTVNDVNLCFEVDTGSAVTAISDSVYRAHFSNYKLDNSKQILLSYNGTPIDVLGVLPLPFAYRSQTQTINVYVVKNGGPPLLGRDFLSKFKLEISPINNLSNSYENQFPRLFSDELGCCEGVEVKLNMKPESIPIFMKARPVPFAIRSKLEEEIYRLQSLGIIEPVTYSEYASPIVPVLRSDGKIRLCADYSSTLNKQLLVEKYPLPRVEELFSKLHNGVHFTKLDLSGAYNQLRLHEDSQLLTCINTHKGLYKFNRLVFGLSSAPAIFQRTLENILLGPDKQTSGKVQPADDDHHPHCSLQEGVLQFLDDILITGRTREEHLARLNEVFRRLEKAGLVLRKEKCSFFQESVSYLGFIIDKHGIHKCPEKVKSIVNAKKPENVSELKSFLGLVNYYRVFIKNASSILAPLHDLLQKNVHWVWTKDHENAFEYIKRCLADENTLAHFNQDARIILTVDASPWGLGAILSQVDKDNVERPVSYASRALTPAEKQYSQIQKEATAIIFGVRKYHQYLYGRSEAFVLRTDHKPLLSIFRPEKGIPEVSANRLQRYALFLSAYNYKIEYVSSANNCADFLSRSMVPQTTPTAVTSQGASDSKSECIVDTACYINFLFDDNASPILLSEVKDLTEQDHTLSDVIKFTRNGWPKTIKDVEIRPYFACRSELSVERGCLMRGCKLVIPSSYRGKVIKELHAGHLGIVKMKLEARTRFWWPGMSEQLQQAVRSCGVCSQLRPSPPRAPLTPWPYPSEPWYRVHIDFLGPINNKMYLIVVDAYSKWVEAYDVSSGYGSKVVIQKLCDVMARFGLINTLCSDNGPSFISSEFEHFCKSNGITHLTSPEYHPASNGQAESYVKIIKKALKSILLSGIGNNNLNIKLNEFLFNYRNSVHSTTNKTPAQVLFGRNLRCRLDLLNPKSPEASDTALLETVRGKQCLQGKSYRGIRNIDFCINDLVSVKIHKNNKTFWVHGVVTRRIGKSAYLIFVGQYNKTIKRHKNQMYKVEGERGVISDNDIESRSALEAIPTNDIQINEAESRPSASQPLSASQPPSASEPPAASQASSAIQPPAASQPLTASQLPSASQPLSARQPLSATQSPTASQPPPAANQPAGVSSIAEPTSPAASASHRDSEGSPTGIRQDSQESISEDPSPSTHSDVGRTLRTRKPVSYRKFFSLSKL